MVEELDFIARFARSKGFDIKPRTIFVEGTTDVDLFQLSAKLEKEKTGIDLLGDKMAIIAAGIGNNGGAKGVCRELVSFKNMASTCLLPNGRPKYRFIGLFDNDNAGRQAISDIRKTDISILEYRDVFRLCPVMPLNENQDMTFLRNKFEQENLLYKGLDWELEDLVPDSFSMLLIDENPFLLRGSQPINDKVHREWTPDGKAKLIRLVKENAMHSDLLAFIAILNAFRQFFNIKSN